MIGICISTRTAQSTAKTADRMDRIGRMNHNSVAVNFDDAERDSQESLSQSLPNDRQWFCCYPANPVHPVGSCGSAVVVPPFNPV